MTTWRKGSKVYASSLKPQASSLRGGFTLLELLVTLALLGFVFAAVTTRFHTMFTKTRLQASGQGVADHFAYAISRSYTAGKYHTLVFDLDAGRYWIQVGREDEEGTQLLKRRLATGVAFAEMHVGYNTYTAPGTLLVEVSPLGMTSDVIVNLTDEDETAYAVSLNAMVQRIERFDEHKTYEDLQDVPTF